MIDTLNELVAINSVSGSEYKIGEHLFDSLCDFNTRREEVETNRNNIISTRGSGKFEVALISHMDTVPPSGAMKTPFSMVVKDDKAYGLGVADMKAGLAANLHAFREYEPENFSLSFVSLVDEELWSKGVNEYLKNNRPDLVIFTEPYLEECVFNASRGRFAIDLSFDIGSGHAAFKSKLPDFFSKLSRFLENLPSHQNERGTSRWTVSKINGGGDFLSVPDTVNLRINHSAVSTSTLDSTLSDIRAALSSVELNATITPADRPTDHPQPYTLSDKNLLEIAKNYGPFRTMDSVFDINFTGMKGINGFNLAVEGGGFHEPVEWVSVSSVYNIQRKLLDLLIDLESHFQ